MRCNMITRYPSACSRECKMITAKLANVLDIWILVFALLATSNTAASAEVDATRFGDAKVGGVSSQLRAVKQDDILHGAENSQRIGKDKPNIIWILLDACRVNLSCYGYERLTSPNIDKLASRGILRSATLLDTTTNLLILLSLRHPT